jgi:hypothetical protein
MAISGQNKLSINRSDDSSDYEAGFHRDALYLIIAGHKILIENKDDYSNEEEPSITGELVRCTNEYIDNFSSPEWTNNYVVNEESPENIKGRLGKDRKRVDIVCTLAGRKPQKRIRFEAKRLKDKKFPVSRYIGSEGLMEFITGNYAPEDDTGGMLGYVQSDDCEYWAKQIPDALSKSKEVNIREDGLWQNAYVENVNHCYKTRHNRMTNNRKFLVYHLLLDFTN